MSRWARASGLVLGTALIASGCAGAPSMVPQRTELPPSPPAISPPAIQSFHTPFFPSARTPIPQATDGVAPAPTARALRLTPAAGEQIPPPADPIPFGQQVTNVLLLGSDRRAGNEFRDDVLILVSLDPVGKQAVVLSIPRDLWVYLPGQGMQRINTSFGIGENRDYPGGGMGLLRDSIQYNLGIPVDRYVRVEMQGFEDLVDALGGVEVLVACSYTDWRLKSPEAPPEKQDSWELFTVPTGPVAMDGAQALWYARARARSSDFDRSRRQQEVLRAVYQHVRDTNLLTRIPSMFQTLSRHASTDLALNDLLKLAPLAADIGPASVRSRFIGREQVEDYRVPTSGAAVLVPKPDALRALLERTFSDEAWSMAGSLDGVQVEVVDASRQPGWAELAAERLAYAGVPTFSGSSAEPSDGPTLLLDLQPGEDSAVQALLQVLGLDDSRVRAAPEPAARARFRLIVADDYNPCFDPTRRQSASDG